MRSRYGSSSGLSSVEKCRVLDCFGAGHSLWVDLAQRVGVPAVEAVMDTFGGTKVHVPQARAFWADLQRVVRNREIRERHNGRNLGDLVLAYGLTERQIRNILIGDSLPGRPDCACSMHGHLRGGGHHGR